MYFYTNILLFQKAITLARPFHEIAFNFVYTAYRHKSTTNRTSRVASLCKYSIQTPYTSSYADARSCHVRSHCHTIQNVKMLQEFLLTTIIHVNPNSRKAAEPYTSCDGQINQVIYNSQQMTQTLMPNRHQWPVI